MSPRQLGKKAAGPRKGTNQLRQHNKDDKVHKASKVHKRSREGCFTCRVRRKKCSEIRPHCTACVSLGIKCEYEQPDWWLPQAVRDERLAQIALEIKDNKVACKPTKALKARSSSRARSKVPGDLVRAPSLPVLAPDLFFDEPLGFPPSSYYTPEPTPSSRDSGTPAFLYYLPVMQDQDFLCNTLDFDNMVMTNATSVYPDLIEGAYGQQDSVSTAFLFQDNAVSSFTNQNITTNHFNNGQQASAPIAQPFRDNAGPSLMSQHLSTNDVNNFTSFDDTMLLPAFDGQNADPNSNNIAPFADETYLGGSDLDAPSQFFPEGDMLWSNTMEPGQVESSYDTSNLEVDMPDTDSILPAGDQLYLDHFLQYFALFPVFDICTSGTVASNVVLPAISTSYTVLQSALKVAAIHKRAYDGFATADTAQDIYRFRTETIKSLIRSLTDGTQSQDILQSVLFSIYLQTMVGSFTDDVPDRPWHLELGEHANLVYQPWHEMSDRAQSLQPLNTAIAFWMDIQGAVLRRTVPLFLPTYVQGLEEGLAAGLGELMGCDDHVMYTIAEIAELDASLSTHPALIPGTTEFEACWTRIDELMEQLHLDAQHGIGGSVLTEGPADPAATSLRSTVTAMYRLVAEIYLISLQPNCNPLDDPVSSKLFDLLETFASLMMAIPDGPDGLDSSFSWLYLIAGSYTQPKSTFRTLFMGRFDQIGNKAKLGNLVKVKDILMDVWHHNDASMMDSTRLFRHWRQVMRENRQGRDWSDVLFL